jgi:hypothetical protein
MFKPFQVTRNVSECLLTLSCCDLSHVLSSSGVHEWIALRYRYFNPLTIIYATASRCFSISD